MCSALELSDFRLGVCLFFCNFLVCSDPSHPVPPCPLLLPQHIHRTHTPQAHTLGLLVWYGWSDALRRPAPPSFSSPVFLPFRPTWWYTVPSYHTHTPARDTHTLTPLSPFSPTLTTTATPTPPPPSTQSWDVTSLPSRSPPRRGMPSPS
jgi:hypothetical protein